MTNGMRGSVTHGCLDRAGFVAIRPGGTPPASSGRRGFDPGLAAVQTFLEAAAQLLAREAHDDSRPARLDPHHPHVVTRTAIATGIALGLRQWPEASHDDRTL